MAVRFLFFAQCADWVNRRDLTLPLEGDRTVLDLVRSRANLAPLLQHSSIVRVAINREFADFSAEVKDGDEVAFIPPVSGG